MKNNKLVLTLLRFMLVLFVPSLVNAAPIFTFAPLTSTTVTVPSNGTVTVSYTIKNMSPQPHKMVMNPITGIVPLMTVDGSGGQVPAPTHCYALQNQSCTLTLTINGNQLSGNIPASLKLPVVSQFEPGSSFLSNNPSPADVLNVTVSNVPVTQYTVIPSAGENGVISPSTPQTVNRCSNIIFTATPNAGYTVNQWLLDGVLVQTGGATFTLSLINANHTVRVTFGRANQTIYSGMQDGNVYYSVDGGETWTATTIPGGVLDTQPVNSLFVTPSTLYAAKADGSVFYSTNQGNTWTTGTQPDGSSIIGIFVLEGAPSVLYAGTENGFLYSSIDNGTSWTQIPPPCAAQPVNGVFAVSTNDLYAGCEDGVVYYSHNGGVNWSAYPPSPDGSPIQDIYISNNLLYVNTEYEYVYTNTSLTPGGSWTTYAQTVFALFVNPTATSILSATQNGHVYSLITGDELGFVEDSSIYSLFATN